MIAVRRTRRIVDEARVTISVVSRGRNVVAARDQNEVRVSVRMAWDICRGGIRDAMGECDALQNPSQSEMAKENVVSKHKHR
jgi:hypothetical protein